MIIIIISHDVESLLNNFDQSHLSRHEAGLDYNRVLPDLIVGSCLQTPADVDRLAEQENVRVVYCLQGLTVCPLLFIILTAVQTMPQPFDVILFRGLRHGVFQPRREQDPGALQGEG